MSDFSKRAFSFYLSKGLPPHQAAALAGNADWESSGNPTVVGDNGKSTGIFQWDRGRHSGLQEFARSQGLDPKAEDTQLAYADWELKNTEKTAGDKFFSSRNLTEANDALMSYLRPQGSENGPQGANGYVGRYNNGAALLNEPGMAQALAMGPSQYVGTAADPQMAWSPQVPAAAPAPTAGATPQIPLNGLLSPQRNPYASSIQSGLGLMSAGSPQQPAQQGMPGLLQPGRPTLDVLLPNFRNPLNRGLLG